MKMHLSLGLVMCLMIGGVGLAQASEKPGHEIVAALDDQLVSIDTSFSGSKVLLFGTREGEGDVVIVVRGPSHTEVVRKQERVFGVWANKDEVSFSNAPSFYNVASSGPIKDLVIASTAQRLELGADYLNAYLAPQSKSVNEEMKATFWQAFLRAKKREGLYGVENTPVKFLGKRLFRADFVFPSNIPVGTYLVYVYLIKDNDVVHSQITPLYVSKTGAEAEIYDFAQRHSFFYGVLAVIIALFSGWFASVVFRKK